MLSIRALTAGYEGGGDVLEGVDLDIGARESVALLGRNGMGKTTLLRAVMGHLRPKSGQVRLDGQELTGRPPFAVSNAGVACVPQGREVFADFTVEENRCSACWAEGNSCPGAGRDLRPLPDPAERRDQKGGTCRRRTAATRHRPRHHQPSAPASLDEPTEGIQPSIVQSIAVSVAASYGKA
jgi:ABC-type branched-subunit amino acid transport system ATPase component